MFIYATGVFGYYSSRVPQSVMDSASTKIARVGAQGARISTYSPWFKVVEHYVTNNLPMASARMYNYLVISGIFRSICTILLVALWFELYYLIHYVITGHEHIGIFMSDLNGIQYRMWSYIVLSTVFIFSLFSYLKFQRRYVEEAIFAFVLAKDE
jgi:hypothetical protein